MSRNEIPRFDIFVCECTFGSHLETEANANGDYCRWEDVEAELNSLKALIEEAPNFFAPQYDFDGKKREWLIKAGLIEDNRETE